MKIFTQFLKATISFDKNLPLELPIDFNEIKIKLENNRKRKKSYFCSLCGIPDFAMEEVRGEEFSIHLERVKGKSLRYSELDVIIKANADKFFKE